jgi:hypothetical protein
VHFTAVFQLIQWINKGVAGYLVDSNFLLQTLLIMERNEPALKGILWMPPPAELSLVPGGPFYRTHLAIGLIRPNRWNVGRRIVMSIAISWVPLFLITLLLDPGGLQSFVMDYRVHARLLIAVPALLIGEIVMESRFREVFRYLRESGLLDVHDMAYMDGVVANLVRLRDAAMPM